MLRVENNLLRRKLDELEGTVQSLENEQRSSPLRLYNNGDASLLVQDERLVSSKLQSMLAQIQAAKDEALQFAEVGKEQLARDVQHLYALLQRSRCEASRASRRAAAKEAEAAALRGRVADLEREVILGEQAFAEIQHHDRAAAQKRLQQAEERAMRREAELAQVLAWVSSRQQCLVAAARALTRRVADSDSYALLVENLLWKDAAGQVAELVADLEILRPTSG